VEAWYVCGKENSDLLNAGNFLTRQVTVSFSRTLFHGVKLS
jgi:hypothetical protein